jgi:tetratricopeptide (TPR) repeat protein
MTRCITLIMLIALAPVALHAQASDDYRFKGKIVDTKGKEIAGVQITFKDVANGAKITFSSGKNGEFDHRMIPSGQYMVSFEKDGYATHTEKFDWSASQSETKTVEAQVVLETSAAEGERTMSKEAADLYDKAYKALEANDCDEATSDARMLISKGAGGREYAARFIIARCAANQKHFDDAVTEYRHVISLKPDFFEARFDLANVLDQQGKHDEAIAEYNEAVKIQPQNADAQYNLGALLMQQKQYDNARPHLEAAVSADSTNAMAAKALGFAYLQGEKKDMKAAKRYLSRYLQLQPNAPDAKDIQAMIAEIKEPSP